VTATQGKTREGSLSVYVQGTASLEEAGQEEESLAMLEEYLRLLSGANDVLRTEGMKEFLTVLSESEDLEGIKWRTS
jgi:hypothetical protein